MISRLEKVVYKKKDLIYLQHQSQILGLDLIFEGEYETFFYTEDGLKVFQKKLSQFSIYGADSIVFNDGISILNVEVKKKTAVYRVPAEYFLKLYKTYDAIYQFIVSAFGTLMLDKRYANLVIRKEQTQDADTFERLFSRRLNTVSTRPIVTCAPDLPIYMAAQLMEDQKTSCLLIEEQDKLIGYITDIVLRNEVIAKKRDVDRPVSEIMDSSVFRLTQNSYIHEAILLMFNHAIRYMIVVREGDDIGLVSRNDLLMGNGQSPFIFIQSFRMSHTPEELKTKWVKLPEVIYQMSDLGVRTEIINRVISSIMDSVLQKVIMWVLDQLPEPPVGFAVMAIGNYGREEVMLNVTQKFVVVFQEDAELFKLEELRSYFTLFAQRISDKLTAVGIEVPKNRFLIDIKEQIKSRKEWTKLYSNWAGDQKGADIYPGFFDIRHLYGEQSLVDSLARHFQKAIQKSSPKFFSRLADYTLAYDLPITFFKNIKTTTKGDREEFDIYQAIGVLVDFTRYFSLKNGINETNTGLRLKQLKDNGVIKAEVYNDLMQSFYYLMGMSLKYQSKQILFDKTAPNNFIDSTNLTTIEIVTLKQIFGLIDEFRRGFKNLPLRMLGKSRDIE